MKEETITIVIPEGATTNTENGLVYLTGLLHKKTGERAYGGLGGVCGYGFMYENDVFMMHPFCWCEKDNCDWCNGDNPNFLYKPTNAKISWYKWIGRSQKQDGKLPKNWLDTCVNSLKP